MRMNFILDIILMYCFDNQCLSECCPSSTTVDKKSTTEEKKAAGHSQDLIYNVIWTFNKMYSNAVNVLPAGYIILQFFENGFTFYLLIYNAQFYFMFMKITL